MTLADLCLAINLLIKGCSLNNIFPYFDQIWLLVPVKCTSLGHYDHDGINIISY